MICFVKKHIPMKKFELITLLLLLLGQPLWSQYDRDAYHIEARSGRNLIQDYTKQPMELFLDEDNTLYYDPDSSQAHRFSEEAITMSDTAGQLSFITNLCHVWRPDGQLIPGTEEAFLYDNFGQDGFCSKGEATGLPQLIVLPIPGQVNVYYYIYARFRIESFNPGFEIYQDSLFYRILDMRANDGVGQMGSEEHFLLADTAIDGSTLAATRHANGLDWWLTVSGVNNDTYVLAIDSQDIVLQDTFTWSEPYRMGLRSGSQATFSPDGDKYARVVLFHGLSLADFDQSTGEFSNIFTLPYEEPDDFFLGTPGVAFSGNNRFLYVNPNTRQLIQYDMEEEGFSAPDTLWVFSEEEDIVFYEDLGNVVFYMKKLKLGADCKIYSLPFGGVPFFHVIHNPNARGEEALFRRGDYRVPSPSIALGLGHHPHWRTSTPREDWCAELYYDSIYTSVDAPGYIPKSSDWQLSPNPARDAFYIEPMEIHHGTAEITVYDQQGRQLFSREHTGGGRQKYSLGGLASGLYFVHIRSRDARGELLSPVVKKLVVQ